MEEEEEQGKEDEEPPTVVLGDFLSELQSLRRRRGDRKEKGSSRNTPEVTSPEPGDRIQDPGKL